MSETTLVTEAWHHEFNPRNFLSRVDLRRLLERNEAYNKPDLFSRRASCILCSEESDHGLYLNDKSFLCLKCYEEVALTTYPEKHEKLHRTFLSAKEAHRLAWEGFHRKFNRSLNPSSAPFWGWASLLLIYFHPAFLAASLILLIFGYTKNYLNRREYEEWQQRRERWELENPSPTAPNLKHFHDPDALLTKRDSQVLKVFDHWPGYPPYWQYLRSVVLARDSHRCQVTGCPSRLELHIHHILPVSDGGPHSPDNLISLCDFHHALEPDKGHERIWGTIKTRYFTLVRNHERSNRAAEGTHLVKAHLRRLRLITSEELENLSNIYGFSCPHCNSAELDLRVLNYTNKVEVACLECGKFVDGPQQLTEETGPLLAEILTVSRNQGRWHARWDMLDLLPGNWTV